MSLASTWRGRVGIDGLFVAGWTGSLALIFVSFTSLVFAFGFWWPYWRAADMDTFVVYEAFLFNDGLAQSNADHPAYLTILLVGVWFKLLHAGGLLPIHALSELPPESDIAASAAAWMRATQAARLLSLVFALMFLGGFATLLRRWLKDWRVAVLATFALTFSGGVMMEARIVRTELIAAAFAYIALLILLNATQRPSGWRALAVGIAALFATLAMENKVHILFVLLTLPPIVVALAEEGTGARRNTWLVLAVSVIPAITLAVLSWPIARTGLDDSGALTRRMALFGTTFPVYQAAIAAWLLLWLVVYAQRFAIGAIESLAALAAFVAGAALGLLVLDIRFGAANSVAVINPIEHMLIYATLSHPDLSEASGALGTPMLQLLLSGAVLQLARLTFVLNSSPRPTIFLEWVVFVMIVFAWQRGERKAILQAVLLIAASWAIDLAGSLRGLKTEYFILADPLIILAAAWLLVRVPALQTHRLAFPVGAVLIVATVAVGLAEPVKHTFKRDIPDLLCTPHFPRTERIGHFSYCP